MYLPSQKYLSYHQEVSWRERVINGFNKGMKEFLWWTGQLLKFTLMALGLLFLWGLFEWKGVLPVVVYSVLWFVTHRAVPIPHYSKSKERWTWVRLAWRR